LREAEARHEGVPVLASFRPPSIVVEVGHPMPEVPRPEELIRESLRVGKLVAALTPREVEALGADGRVRVTILGTIEGFDVEKFRLRLVRIAWIDPTERAGVVRGGAATRIPR
jgi:hypothetical protein